MIKRLLLITLLLNLTKEAVCSSGIKRNYEVYADDEEEVIFMGLNDTKSKRLRSEESVVMRLEDAIKFDKENNFVSILKRQGCDVMEPENNNLLEDLIKNNNAKYLRLLFSKACPGSYDLYMKALGMAYETHDKSILRSVLLSIFGPFAKLSHELVDFFLKRDDLDAIYMIFDIGYSLDHYQSRECKNIAHVAVEKGRLDILKKIKNHDLFLKRDQYGREPIFYAQDLKIIKEIRRKCPQARDRKNYQNLTTWQESLIEKDFVRLNALISLKRRIKKFKRTFLNFYDIAWRSSASILKIRREMIVSDSFKEVQKIADKWYRPKNEFFIKYIGEIGLDSGGLKVDWVNNLFRKFFSETDSNALFVKIDDETGCFAPNTKQNAKMFKFAGSIVALSIGLGVPMKVKLIPVIYRLILGDFMDFDSDLMEQSRTVYNNLHFLEDLSVNLKELELIFPKNRSKKVSRRNLGQYIKEYTRHAVYGAYEKHIEAFVEGFRSVLSEEIGHFFTREELIRILKGSPVVFTAEEFVNNCTFPSRSVKRDLLTIISDFTDKQKSLLLQFVTGSETLPLEGFSGLKNGGIQVSVLDELVGKLPTSSTCSNLLKLPPYEDVAELRTKLILAIELAETIDFEPGMTERDGIVLGFDDANPRRIDSRANESASDVSSDEEETKEVEESKPYIRKYTTFF